MCVCFRLFASSSSCSATTECGAAQPQPAQVFYARGEREGCGVDGGRGGVLQAAAAEDEWVRQSPPQHPPARGTCIVLFLSRFISCTHFLLLPVTYLLLSCPFVVELFSSLYISYRAVICPRSVVTVVVVVVVWFGAFLLLKTPVLSSPPPVTFRSSAVVGVAITHAPFVVALLNNL
jgi:hypothetical protein